jgi:hypothetical protein
MIRVLIKRGESIRAVHLRIDFNEELESISNTPLFTRKKKKKKHKKKVVANSIEQQQEDSDQLSFNLFEDDPEF